MVINMRILVPFLTKSKFVAGKLDALLIFLTNVYIKLMGLINYESHIGPISDVKVLIKSFHITKYNFV